MKVVTLAGLAALAILLLQDPAHAQRGRGRGGPPPAAKAAAPVDLTGYWVSVVTEDWRFRMLTPRKGDYESVPLTAEARRVADGWDPAKDEAAGDLCKAYGPPGVMRAPGRLHITWDNDDTLRIDADAGTQTRLFDFAASPSGGDAPTLAGHTAAQWELSGGRPGPNPGGAAAGVSATAGKHGWLKAVTTRMRPGYLRKNGSTDSGNAVLTEYLDRLETNGGQSWLIVTQMIEDPQYLTSTFVVSSNFRKEPDGSKWTPSPCSTR